MSQKLPHPQIPVVSDNEARGAWPAPGDAGTEFWAESRHVIQLSQGVTRAVESRGDGTGNSEQVEVKMTESCV
jgi:hypothetical protein